MRTIDRIARTERWSQLRDVVTRPSSLSVVDQAIVSATNLATGVVLGRLCAAEGYGSYVLAMTVAIIGSGILAELVTNPYTVYGQRRGGASLARYTGSALIHLVFASVLIVGAILGAITLVGQIDKLWTLLPVVIVAAPLIMTREFVRQMSFARFRFQTALLVDMTVTTIQLSGLFLLWWFNMLSAGWALASLGTACGVAVVCWMIGMRSHVSMSVRHAKLHAVRNWRFARWTMIAYLIGSTTPFIMPWVLAGFHSEEHTGRLAAANTLIGLSFMFVTGVSNWLTAKAAREYQTTGADGLRHILRNTVAILMTVLVPFVAFVWMFGEELVVLVFGPDFSGLGFVSFIIAIGILANTGNVVAGNGLWAIDRPQDGLWADATTLISTMVLALWMVPPIGIEGAAWATTLGQAAGAAVRTRMLQKALALRDPLTHPPNTALAPAGGS